MGSKASIWNPWHGCHKLSEGCRHCYVYRSDGKYGKDSSVVAKTEKFNLPLQQKKNKTYKIPSGNLVYTCFTSDFLLEEADAWRAEAWEMMRIRHDLRFLFFTKRIDRLAAVLPPDWGDGYDNVRIEVDGNVSFENAVKMRAAGADLFVAGTSAVFREGGSSSAPRCWDRSTSHAISRPPSRRSRRAANRATRPGRATTPGCSGCVNSAWRQTSPSASTRPGRGS